MIESPRYFLHLHLNPKFKNDSIFFLEFKVIDSFHKKSIRCSRSKGRDLESTETVSEGLFRCCFCSVLYRILEPDSMVP